MGLFSKKNIDKAKSLAKKNAEKIASGVDKATDAIDKKTGGKHHDKLQKVDAAAAKFAGKEPDATSATDATDADDAAAKFAGKEPDATSATDATDADDAGDAERAT